MTELNGICAGCAHWAPLTTRDGACRRYAPRPRDAANEAAHWPRTHAMDVCGEWRDAARERTRIQCGYCAFWKHPAEGLHPENFADQAEDFWRQAGYCLRHAPKPSAAPGQRAFWRATHRFDGCAEGEGK
jgi:hypothetical protein